MESVSEGEHKRAVRQATSKVGTTKRALITTKRRNTTKKAVTTTKKARPTKKKSATTKKGSGSITTKKGSTTVKTTTLQPAVPWGGLIIYDDWDIPDITTEDALPVDYVEETTTLASTTTLTTQKGLYTKPSTLKSSMRWRKTNWFMDFLRFQRPVFFQRTYFGMNNMVYRRRRWLYGHSL